MRLTPPARLLPLLVLALAACHRGPDGGPGAPSASASAAANHPPPLAIALGTVRGRVTIDGDPAPTDPEVLAQIPDECASARAYYGPVFRREPDGALADAMVAVTGYRGTPPARRPYELVIGEACRWDKRTIVLEREQRLAIAAKDRFGYVPALVGGNSPFSMIPMPGAEPVEIKPPKPGRFALIDEAHRFMRADVFVVGYPTFDVTGVDGRFEIADVPAGTVKVSALLPALMITAEQQVEVRAGAVTEVTLALRFDERLHRPDPSAAPVTSASAAPAAASSAAAATGSSAIPATPRGH